MKIDVQHRAVDRCSIRFYEGDRLVRPAKWTKDFGARVFQKVDDHQSDEIVIVNNEDSPTLKSPGRLHFRFLLFVCLRSHRWLERQLNMAGNSVWAERV